jgi:hypothetical protein
VELATARPARGTRVFYLLTRPVGDVFILPFVLTGKKIAIAIVEVEPYLTVDGEGIPKIVDVAIGAAISQGAG